MSPYSYIIVHYCDTDIFVILLANYLKLKAKGKTVFLKRKTGYLNIFHIAETLLAIGINLTSLPLTNALSGCDTTSYFYGSGKTMAGLKMKNWAAIRRETVGTWFHEGWIFDKKF